MTETLPRCFFGVEDTGGAGFPLGAALLAQALDSALRMGYGTTLIPVLLQAGFTPLQVVSCVLLSELMTGIAAVFMHQRDGNVDFLHDRQARGVALMLSLLLECAAIRYGP